MRRYSVHFCNKKCHLDFIRINIKNESKENCAYCKASILRTRVQKQRSRSGLFFCSRTCGNRYKAANHGRWNIENPKNHRGRSKKILEKANNACQKCGYDDDPRMLDIHHHDEDHSNNSWDNLRCACVWCHVKHHRKVEKLDLPVLTINGA